MKLRYTTQPSDSASRTIKRPSDGQVVQKSINSCSHTCNLFSVSPNCCLARRYFFSPLYDVISQSVILQTMQQTILKEINTHCCEKTCHIKS